MAKRQVLGKYELLEQIGKGTTGAVFRARRTDDGRMLAVKVLYPQMARKEVVLKRFLREAETASRLRHPNAVQVEMVEQSGQYVYYAMEYVGGQTLDSVLKLGGPFEEKRALTYMKKIADVLGAAHRMNILHRDIKPANIILTNEGEPKLADLGLAKLLEESEDADSLTMEGQTLGTPHFIAPEQVDAGEVDARTDLYGLGCTFFRLMTGEYVYQSEVAIAAVLLAQSTKPARKVRDVRPELSPHTEAIIDKCLQKKKEDRYEYAGQLIEDIDAVLAGKPPVHAKPPQPKRAAPKRAAGDAPGAGKRPRRAAARAKGKSGCLVVLAALTVTVGSLLLALL